MALITLLRRWGSTHGHRTALMLAALGVFGASLFFGDSMITPAISVLSAIEGIEVVDPDFEKWVVPITRGHHRRRCSPCSGTAQPPSDDSSGRSWSPGSSRSARAESDGIVGHPEILKALSPTYALTFIVGHFEIAFFALDRSRARRHRRRGALRRHGSLRPQGDHPSMAVRRPARACSQLHGPRRPVDRRPRRRCAAPFFLLIPALGVVADGAIGHRRNGYRVAGSDHRRVLRGIASRSHRVPAAVARDPHVCRAAKARSTCRGSTACSWSRSSPWSSHSAARNAWRMPTAWP